MTTALVTGATSGIGRAIALELAGAGHDVYAVGRSRHALEQLRASAKNITPICLDVTDREAVEATIPDLHVDVLVNNAGMMPPLCSFADAKMGDIDTTLEVNLSAVIALTRHVVAQMRERQSGHIVFIGSAAAHSPFPNMAVYSATKAGISGFAAALRADLSPFGVRVTEVVPGRVQTALYEDILDDDARRAMYSAVKAVQPEDVAQMVRAVLALPEWADVTRFDIMTTRPTTPNQQVKK